MTSPYAMHAAALRWLLTLCLMCLASQALATQQRLPDTTHADIDIVETWIAMPDGVRLAASLYLPAGRPPQDRLPVLLEYLPYRKDESRAGRFSLFSYFVYAGYAVARVDIRGTGSSEGRLVDYEYTEQEQLDGEVVIDWLSRQAWSSGKVGMFGISWGAFNSIQMAMRNPPALKAIVPVMGTDDIYRDDVHFTDGMMHVDAYELGQDVANILPAPPDYVIDEAYFRDRFDTTPWLLTYKRHPHDGPFWNRASLDSDYRRIRIPTYAIGGWYDGYRDSVPRMLEHLQAPVKGMLGPWIHTFPNWPYPEPGIEWRREAVRWFDHWLKGEDTGIMAEPAFAVFVRDWHPPGPQDHVPGQWRYEEGWPLQRTEYRAMYPRADHSLSELPPPDGDVIEHQLAYRPTVGVEAAGNVMWWGDFPWDQRGTDAYSLTYDTPPLDAAVEMLGMPEVVLQVAASAPQANWIVRVSDIAPDGTVTQVAGAGLNGAHRHSAEQPVALVPGEIFELRFRLHFSSWVFPPGHRIRLAVNNAQWPMFWPTPYAMTTRLVMGGATPSKVILPIVPYEKRPVPAFDPPASSPELPGDGSVEVGEETESGYAEIKRITRLPLRQATVIEAPGSSGSYFPWAVMKTWDKLVHEANDADPARASVSGSTRYQIEQDGRRLVIEGLLEVRSDVDNFYYEFTRRVLENDRLLREKTWQETLPRKHH